jgi:type II secretory pathway pseudopilin PulG
MAHKKAFTLVELIVWVTISMLLMTSVWILVSGGMQNILKQQKIMQKNSLLTTSVSDFYNGFDNITQSWGYIHDNASGALFKINQNIQKWGFWYFWIISQDNQYCPTDSDLPTLEYLTWKTFIPYEEIGEDIMNNYSNTTLQEVSSGSITYKVDTINHKIYENDWLGDNVIVWWDVFWHEFTAWADGTDVRLNNPTWIVLAEWGFFFSDTLNHRVLFYENWKVSLILDKNDGLTEPTWLAYDNLKNILYIANSWKWEILKYSSEKKSTNPDLEIKFTPDIGINSVHHMNLKFPSLSWNLNPLNWSDFDFTNINNWSWYIKINWNTLEYYFTDYHNISQPITNGPIPWCIPSDTYSLNSTTPEREIYTCIDTNTWTYQKHDWNITQTLSATSDIKIKIENILPIFTSPGTHLVEFELLNNGTPRYQETFKFFTQGDQKVKNWENMTLTIFANNLGFPTGLKLNWLNTELKVNDFISRKVYTYTLSNLNRTDTNLTWFTAENFAQFNYSSLTDTILGNPISEISVNYDIPTKYFSTNIQYYQFINCYNSDEKVEKTLIFSKDLQ